MQTFEYLRERRPSQRPSRRSAYGVTSVPTGVHAYASSTHTLTSPRYITDMTSHSARTLRDRNSDEQVGRREPEDVADNIARQIPCFAISGTDTILESIFESHPHELLKVHKCCTNIAKRRNVSHRYFIENRYCHVQITSPK